MQKVDLHVAPNWQRIDDPRACELLADRAVLRLLAPFIGQACTVTKAAQILEMPVSSTYKAVKRFEALGLVRVVEREARAGRAINHYRAVAEQFFIPFKLYPPELIRLQSWTLHQALFQRGIERLYREERFVEQDWGVVTKMAPNGGMYLEITSGSKLSWSELNAQGPAVVSNWYAMYLEFEDAKALQQELTEVLFKYMDKRGSRKYLLGAFLTDVEGLE